MRYTAQAQKESKVVDKGETGMEGITIFGMDAEIFAIKLAYLIAVLVIALIVQHTLVRLCRHLLHSIERLPTATIIINCVRIVVWIVALLFVLQPVFGIDPAGFVAALGVASIVISLGLKDTISNIFGGLMLMVGRVVQPGDYVTIAGVTGTVVDITLRHTVVENRLEEHVVIPNSILNTTSIQRLPASSESRGTFEFTMDAGYNPNEVAQDIIETTTKAAADLLRPDMETHVMFEGVTPYGVRGLVFFYAREGVTFTSVRNAMVRSIAQKEYFSAAGARALSQGEELI